MSVNDRPNHHHHHHHHHNNYSFPSSIKTFLRENDLVKHIIAGAASGGCSSMLTCPLDVVKTRLQHVYPPLYRGTVHGLMVIAQKEGYRGWYRGLSATLLGYLPSWAIYFTVYEETKHYLFKMTRNNTLPLYYSMHQYPICIHILSAMNAGIVSAIVTNPLWVIKSRFMTQSDSTPYHYKSVYDAFRQILAKEKIRGMYKGLATSLFGVTHVVIQFPLYEKFKTLFHHINHPISAQNILAASVLSKIIASILTYPHEVIRTRLQNQTFPIKYTSIRHCLTRISNDEGLSALYRGLSTNLIRTVPASAITLFTYERLSVWLDWVCL